MAEGGESTLTSLSSSYTNNNIIGVTLAASSSLCIGASFIIKKKGLRRSGSRAGHIRAGSGGYSYLREPLWWLGLICMVMGEAANFAAYAFAPAIIVTPLGALSIVVSAVLAHVLLRERLNRFGVIGCVLCMTGTLGIVLHAPEEHMVGSVVDIWHGVTQPRFMIYVCFSMAVVYHLIWKVPVESQTSNVLVYVAICSLVGSLSVVSCKALGMALKMTFLDADSNQLVYPQTYVFLLIVIAAVMTQMNYLNKALDLFNTAIVTPIYYVMFTTLTIVASSILFPQYQDMRDVVSQMAGFMTIVCGTVLLHTTTKEANVPLSSLPSQGNV
jgi:drug/metabolite transporter (DMT)-like permease